MKLITSLVILALMAVADAASTSLEDSTIVHYSSTTVEKNSTIVDDISVEGCLEDDNSDPGHYYGVGIYDTTITGTQTMQWTWNGGEYETILSIDLKPRAGRSRVNTIAGGVGQHFVTLEFVLYNTCHFGWDLEITYTEPAESIIDSDEAL